MRRLAVLWLALPSACPAPPGDEETSRDADVTAQEVVDADADATLSANEVEAEVTEEVASAETTPTCVPAACPDDDDPCTDPACDGAGRCAQVPNLRPCDDGDACTVDDRCAGGACHGRALDCDDDEQCTDDLCDDGRCKNTPRAGPCDDDDACTVDDACADGACGGSTRACPTPPNSFGCAVATCDPRTGCGLRDNVGGCDDGDACTTGERCDAGLCVGALVACDDDDPCTDDYCDPGVGCTTSHNRAACDDGDPCTEGDRCDSGACVAGATTGCCGEDADCDDGDPCTAERCEAGRCQRGPACDDGQPCTIDGCSAGVCSAVPSPLVPAGGLVLASFEATLGAAWTLSRDNPEVGWQRDDHWSWDGDWSLYVGKLPDYSYDFGATRAVASWRVALPRDAVTLEAVVSSEVAETSCSYDALTFVVDGEPLTPPVCGSGTGAATWDVARWAGRWVTLELVFDTVDAEDNAGAGVWVDALAVKPGSAALCCAAGVACD